MEKNNMKPNHRGKEISLLGLFGKETFEILQKRMADATEFSFSTIDYKGNEIVSGCYQPCYKKYLKQQEADPSVQMADAFAAAKAAIVNLPYIYLCQSGLVKVAIPIVVNEQYLGAVICGNVRCDDISYIDPDTGVPLINVDFPNGNMEKAEKVLYDFPVISAKKIKIYADMIFYVIQEIAKKESYVIHLGNEEHNRVHLDDIRKKNGELKETIKDLELKSMKSDLYPQTLLNMLVTLSNMAIVEDASRTAKIAGTFSSILRYYLESAGEQVSLDAEMKTITDYLKVVQMQYQSHISLNITYQDNVKRQRLPKLILFPLMEYLVNFGILDHDFTGEIYGNAEMISGRCIITFRLKQKAGAAATVGFLNDSGKVMDEKSFYQQLLQVRKRLAYEYGENFKLSVESDEIIVDIPGMLKD